ncbi:response regulator transcription factor [Alkalibacter rhizosphaerae]|uniref:Stage 0 sporulation protein A homolog n=1 Tax=Alkalibacter rhizosphaerae TaxID=2815577 RepID=A0A974XG17_9FIRM|nr:response regulator transcription factor [Alkalibacter rhizosphaerae]QSX07623.1 response regulator transcription factor [Alkalibacter rhizosphaerae]
MKVIIVDDDELVSLSLKTILQADPEMEVAATGKSGEEALTLYEIHRPDILLMDIRMEQMDGIQAGEEILRRHPEGKIVYLTTFSDDEYIVKALRMGAKGYILKQRFDSIVPSLKLVHMGQNIFGSEIMDKIPGLLHGDHEKNLEDYGLTEREREVLYHVAQGLSNKEIAAVLFLSEGTVRNYISTTLDKLELRDRTQLAVFYYRWKEGEETT